MPKITLSEWDRLMAEGATTYAVGRVTKPAAVFASRAVAGQAAAEGDGRFVQWDGHTGHKFTAPEYESEAEPEA